MAVSTFGRADLSRSDIKCHAALSLLINSHREVCGWGQGRERERERESREGGTRKN